MKRRAFTLIELLITAVIFVVVAGYAVVVFSSTIGFTAQSQRSSGAAAQSEQALAVVAHAFSQSSTASPVAVLTTGDNGTGGSSAVIFTVTVPNNLGAPSATTEQRAYCANLTANGTYRLAQFIIVGTYPGGSTSTSCTAAGLNTAFGGTATVTGPTFLTDASTNVTSFMVVPTQFDTSAPAPDPSALRIVLTSIYDPTTAASTETRTGGSTAAHPITVETTALRNLPSGMLPFTGL